MGIVLGSVPPLSFSPWRMLPSLPCRAGVGLGLTPEGLTCSGQVLCFHSDTQMTGTPSSFPLCATWAALAQASIKNVFL